MAKKYHTWHVVLFDGVKYDRVYYFTKKKKVGRRDFIAIFDMSPDFRRSIIISIDHIGKQTLQDFDYVPSSHYNQRSLPSTPVPDSEIN